MNQKEDSQGARRSRERSDVRAGVKVGRAWSAVADVNEEGTEAAAATAVVVTTKSLQLTPEFRADHPFVFLIRDKRSDSILFLGRVADPRK